MRRAAVETGLQQPPATSIATLKPSYYCPPVTSLLATRRIALRRIHPPLYQTPQSRARCPSSHHRPRIRSLASFGRRAPCTLLLLHRRPPIPFTRATLYSTSNM